MKECYIPKIMIVEDEKDVALELAALLESAGYEAEIFEDFENLEEILSYADADMILLDINLPGINGDNLLKLIRENSDIPVLIVTSRANAVDEVKTMSNGADDYITKPYNPTILLLRIKNIFNRLHSVKQIDRYKDLHIDVAKGSLYNEHKEILLTKNEMIIFKYLLDNQGEIVNRDVLMTKLWDNEEYINDNALTVNISRLRKKMAMFGYEDVIATRKGRGYILI